MSHLKQLTTEGFITLESCFDQEEVKRLVAASELLLHGAPVDAAEFARLRSGSQWEYAVSVKEDALVAVDVLGKNKDFDELIEKYLTQPAVCEALRYLHGDNYKLTQVNIRRSPCGDNGLSFHQDTDGETGIGILLNKTDSEGTTIFIPGSHRWPFTIRQLLVWPRIFIWLFPRSAYKAAMGSIGDSYVFINRLWHGRSALKTPPHSTAILMSFFGGGGSYRIHEVPENILQDMGSQTRRLVDPKSGVRPVGGGIVTVDESTAAQDQVMQTVLVRPEEIEKTGLWLLALPWVFMLRFVSRFIAAIR